MSGPLGAEEGGRLRRRLQRRTTLVAVGASLIGAVLVVAYLSVLSPSEAHGDFRPGTALGFAVSGGFFLVATALFTRVASLAYRCLRWLDEGREPTDRERRSTLRYPGRIALTTLVGWMVAAGVMAAAAAAAGATGRDVGRTATTIALVGLFAATLVAFSLERIGRPVFARALEGDVALPTRWLGLQPRLLLGWMVSSAVPLASLLLLPWTTADEDRGDVGVTIFSLSALGIVGGLAITSAAARSIAAPLRDVRKALRAVGRGDLDVQVPVDASGELGHVQQGVNAMVAGIREQRRVEALLGRHVGAEVAQLALAGGELVSDQREATALFVDVVGSTAMAERLPAEEVVARLNALFAAVVRVVADHGGFVNKFDGDGALCVFGAPGVQPDHATLGLRAARALRAEVVALAQGIEGFDAGIGVACGTVVAGPVGPQERHEYTVLGRPVNLAARLTDAAKGHPARVLASTPTVRAASAEEAAWWEPSGAIEVRGLDAPVEVSRPR
jgi:adenylate cyclase